MQLGTRWTAREQPPKAVPEVLHAQIAAVEAALNPDGLSAPAPKWTLTFLEGRPVAELDTGVIVSQDAAGEVVVRYDDDAEFACASPLGIAEPVDAFARRRALCVAVLRWLGLSKPPAVHRSRASTSPGA